jgi:hypothetical protein
MSKPTPFDIPALLARLDAVDKKTAFYEAFTVFAALNVIYFVGNCVYNRYFHPLRHFPGPVAASLTEFYLPWSFFFGVAEHLVDEKRHARYGSIVRKAPNLLQINDPEVSHDSFGLKENKVMESVVLTLMIAPADVLQPQCKQT